MNEALTPEEARAHIEPTYDYMLETQRCQTAVDYEDMEILFTSTGTDQDEISLEGVGADVE